MNTFKCEEKNDHNKNEKKINKEQINQGTP